MFISDVPRRRSLRADHFRNRSVSLSVCPLNNWTSPACPLPWPPSRPPNPLPQPQGPQDSVSDRRLALHRTGCHFLPPHTKPVIAPGPQTRNNYLQNHAWVFKHAPSSCGHGIWQILLSPKSFHQEKGPPSFLVEAFTLASLLSLNKYLRETQSQWRKSLKCQPCGKCRSRDLADLLQELHFRDRPVGGKPCFICEDSWATDESRVNDDHNYSWCANSPHSQRGTFRSAASDMFFSPTVWRKVLSSYIPILKVIIMVTFLYSRWTTGEKNILCEYNNGLNAWST